MARSLVVVAWRARLLARRLGGDVHRLLFDDDPCLLASRPTTSTPTVWSMTGAVNPSPPHMLEPTMMVEAMRGAIEAASASYRADCPQHRGDVEETIMLGDGPGRC